MRTAALILLGFTTPAFADGHQPDLSDLVTDSLGYNQIRDNVVMIEGETMGTFICKFNVSDEAFASYAENGALDGQETGYTCIPVEEFEK